MAGRIFSAYIFLSTIFVSGNMVASDLFWAEIEKQVQAQSKIAVASCVSLRTTKNALGSGVIVSEDGLILTSAHLFTPGESKAQVRCHDGKTRVARVLNLDREIDIAWVRFVSYSPKKSSIATLSFHQKTTKDGSTFLATGHASGGYSPDSPKSPLRVGFGFFRRSEGLIFTTCRITAGDSGGPLFDLEGNLRGIHRTMDAAGKFSSHVSIEKIKEHWPKIAGEI